MKSLIFFSLLPLTTLPVLGGAFHVEDRKGAPEKNKQFRSEATPHSVPKRYSYTEPTENGGVEIIESDNRCVSRTKRDTNPHLRYLYDIEADQVLHLPAFRPAKVIVTDRKKDRDGREGKPTGEFEFSLEETPESLAAYQRLKEAFPKAIRQEPLNPTVVLTTRDWAKVPVAKGWEVPTKISEQKWKEANQQLHFVIEDKDAAILLAMHKNRERFPLEIRFNSHCAPKVQQKSRVAFNPTTITHVMHYENEESYAYPEDTIRRIAILMKSFNENQKNDTESIEKRAREILETFAAAQTEKDTEMIKAFGFASTEKAIDDIITRLKLRPQLPYVLMNLHCQGHQSCLAGLLYEMRISRANTPKNFSVKGQLIDVLDEKRWAELLEAEDYDGPKAFAKLEQGKSIVYKQHQVDLIERIQKKTDEKRLRTLFTNKWNTATPDKPLILKTDYFAIDRSSGKDTRK